jgi:molybdenum cofactor cytidylyltransferase
MTSRHFALIPAAGHSTRMKEPKLLLSVAGQPLIMHSIAAWKRSKVDEILIVIRPGDESLAEVVRTASTEVVIPDKPPPDMKASLQAAIRYIDRDFAPDPDDAFLVAPADMPRLSAPIIDRLIARHIAESTKRILVPTLAERRGHPVLFPWFLASEIHGLGAEEGLDAIVRRHGPQLVPCEDLVAPGEYPFADIDTPEDFNAIFRHR